MLKWQKIFSKNAALWTSATKTASPLAISSLSDLKTFLDAVHIRFCLVRPYQENKKYPIVEARELLPSFDNDMFEYKDLPGFSLVAFERRLNYFSEIFQYDKLHSVLTDADGAYCPLENQVFGQNLLTLATRVPRALQEQIREVFKSADTSLLETYPALMPYLLVMDRAHVLSWDSSNHFHLSGVFASFPSDIDSEIKRFGLKIGKFAPGDNDLYERNRTFVYQYLMELYGFPIVSERRTSSALFSRKLHKMGESFLLRVLGQTDRTITTYLSDGTNRSYPLVEKIALIAVDPDQKEAIERIDSGGYFLDRERRVIIIRIRYKQHRFNPGNIRQDRALSVMDQEVLHPLTGEVLADMNIIKDTSNMFLRLNDIVQGEYTGKILFKRQEVIENTDTHEKRLKFLYTWLGKHQRRMISYSDEFFANVVKVLSNYLYSSENDEVFDNLRELYKEVESRFSYIQQARRVRILEDICNRNFKGQKISYLTMMKEASSLLTELSYEMVNFFPDIVESIMQNIDKILHNKYIEKTYLAPTGKASTNSAIEIRKLYGRIVSLHDRVIDLKRHKTAPSPKN